MKSFKEFLLLEETDLDKLIDYFVQGKIIKINNNNNAKEIVFNLNSDKKKLIDFLKKFNVKIDNTDNLTTEKLKTLIGHNVVLKKYLKTKTFEKALYILKNKNTIEKNEEELKAAENFIKAYSKFANKPLVESLVEEIDISSLLNPPDLSRIDNIDDLDDEFEELKLNDDNDSQEDSEDDSEDDSENEENTEIDNSNGLQVFKKFYNEYKNFKDLSNSVDIVRGLRFGERWNNSSDIVVDLVSLTKKSNIKELIFLKMLKTALSKFSKPKLFTEEGKFWISSNIMSSLDDIEDFKSNFTKQTDKSKSTLFTLSSNANGFLKSLQAVDKFLDNIKPEWINLSKIEELINIVKPFSQSEDLLSNEETINKINKLGIGLHLTKKDLEQEIDNKESEEDDEEYRRDEEEIENLASNSFKEFDQESKKINKILNDFYDEAKNTNSGNIDKLWDELKKFAINRIKNTSNTYESLKKGNVEENFIDTNNELIFEFFEKAKKNLAMKEKIFIGKQSVQDIEKRLEQITKFYETKIKNAAEEVNKSSLKSYAKFSNSKTKLTRLVSDFKEDVYSLAAAVSREGLRLYDKNSKTDEQKEADELKNIQQSNKDKKLAQDFCNKIFNSNINNDINFFAKIIFANLLKNNENNFNANLFKNNFDKSKLGHNNIILTTIKNNKFTYKDGSTVDVKCIVSKKTFENPEQLFNSIGLSTNNMSKQAFDKIKEICNDDNNKEQLENYAKQYDEYVKVAKELSGEISKAISKKNIVTEEEINSNDQNNQNNVNDQNNVAQPVPSFTITDPGIQGNDYKGKAIRQLLSNTKDVEDNQTLYFNSKDGKLNFFAKPKNNFKNTISKAYKDKKTEIENNKATKQAEIENNKAAKQAEIDKAKADEEEAKRLKDASDKFNAIRNDDSGNYQQTDNATNKSVVTTAACDPVAGNGYNYNGDKEKKKKENTTTYSYTTPNGIKVVRRVFD